MSGIDFSEALGLLMQPLACLARASSAQPKVLLAFGMAQLVGPMEK